MISDVKVVVAVAAQMSLLQWCLRSYMNEDISFAFESKKANAEIKAI